jgi:hypothetical protein
MSNSFLIILIAICLVLDLFFIDCFFFNFITKHLVNWEFCSVFFFGWPSIELVSGSWPRS